MYYSDSFVDAYLKRIGTERPSELTERSLMELTRAHLEHVPFETLEMTEAHTEPSLEPDALVDKIVFQRRGGYCFELNKLFFLLLQALGFTCYPVGVRVLMGRPEPRPISHRGIVVELHGEKWYCDVGFGGQGPKGILRLADSGLQTITYEHFQVLREEDGDYVILYRDGGQTTRMLKFRDEPWLDVDFTLLNGYYANHSHSPFVQKRILYLCKEDGWISFVGNVFTSFCCGETATHTVLEEDQVRSLVSNEFGLHIPQWD